MFIVPGDFEFGVGLTFGLDFDHEETSRSGGLVVGLFDQAVGVGGFGVARFASEARVGVDQGAAGEFFESA